MGGILWYILVGFLAGTLAKLLMPGDKNEPKGCILTILLGIAGAVLVGFLMETLLNSQGRGGLIPSVTGATIGAIILVWLSRKFTR
jgi:uncharacterized membrane protein YeaQ/YmgE (transglycosylase-associated protein family)